MTKIRKIRVEGDVAYVPLTRGYEAVIDAADVHLVDGFNWTAKVTPHAVYARRGVRFGGKQRSIVMHRLISGHPSGLEVDHINRNGLDNRRSNLRAVTKSQNMQNTKIRKDSGSGYKGVHWHSDGKWQAKIAVDRKQTHLGLFESPEEAYAAYCSASAKFHGQFGRTQ